MLVLSSSGALAEKERGQAAQSEAPLTSRIPTEDDGEPDSKPRFTVSRSQIEIQATNAQRKNAGSSAAISLRCGKLCIDKRDGIIVLVWRSVNSSSEPNQAHV